MTHVLVNIPANETCSYRRVTTMAEERAANMLAQSRITKEHWFRNMQVIDNPSDWPRYGYIQDKNGLPVKDPKKISLAKAEYDQAELDRQRLEHSDDPTVGDIKDQMKILKAKLEQVEAKQGLDVEQIRSQVIAEERERTEDEEVTSQPAPRKRTNKRET